MAGTILIPDYPGVSIAEISIAENNAIAENTAITGLNKPASPTGKPPLCLNPISQRSKENNQSSKENSQRSKLADSPAKNIKRLSALRLPKRHIQNSQPRPLLLPLQQSANDASGMLTQTYRMDFATPKHNALQQHFPTQRDSKTRNLDMLMLGLSQSRRWVFHLYDRFHVKASYNNLLQVKLSEQAPVVEWVYKILQAGQCAAILLENNGISEAKLQTIKALCHSANVVLVLIEGRAEKLN